MEILLVVAVLVVIAYFINKGRGKGSTGSGGNTGGGNNGGDRHDRR